MAVTILGGLWEKELKGQTEKISLHHHFMIALAQYIQENVTFEGIFTGVNPMGAPLTTSITMKVNPGILKDELTGCNDPKGGDGYTQWKEWIMQVYSKITADCGLQPSSFIPDSPIPCFKLTSPITWDRPDLLNAVKGNEYSPQAPFLDRMAIGFMDDMRIDYIPAFSGKVSNYTGTFTVSKVITP